jgi:protein-tyrosine phosphatase
MTQTRHIPLNGTFNLRDLGGYPALSGETGWRQLLRADSLHRLGPAEMDELRRLGCATIIDLRGPDELALHPNPFAAVRNGVAYHNISLFSGLDPARSPAETAEDVLLALYCQALEDCGAAFVLVLRVIAAAPGPALFHCTAGKDRTGMIAALLLQVAGTPRERIIEDYALTSLQAPAMFAALRSELEAAGRAFDPNSPLLPSKASTMAAFLDHLDHAHGGAEAFLSSNGLLREDIAALQARLIQTAPEGVA